MNESGVTSVPIIIADVRFNGDINVTISTKKCAKESKNCLCNCESRLIELDGTNTIERQIYNIALPTQIWPYQIDCYEKITAITILAMHRTCSHCINQ